MRAKPISLLLTLLLIATAVLAAGCIADQKATATATTTNTTPAMLTGVPDVRQAEYYSCGAGSMQAVLSYYGITPSSPTSGGCSTPPRGTAPTPGTW